MGMLAEPRQGGLGGAVRASKCPVNASEGASELPDIAGKTPVSQALGGVGAEGCRDSRKKREVLSAPHRAWFHPH